MGSLFGKSKKPQSRVTEQDKAILQLKTQRDRLKQYQRRIELSLENDRELAKKCLRAGRKSRAISLLRKKKFQENLLANTDKQLENLEKMAMDIEFAQIEVDVVNGLKSGNEALKKIHETLDINQVESILEETLEGVEKQKEIDAMLSDVLTQQDEDDVLAELDALETEEITAHTVVLPDVPREAIEEQAEEEEKQKVKAIKVKKPVAIEA